MMKLILKSLLLALSLTSATSSHATIWITIADEKSDKIGAVGASSGYIGENDTVVWVDNFGIAMIGANYLPRYGRGVGDMRALLTDYRDIDEMAEIFSNRINRDRPRRVTLVTSRFETATRASWGCNADNQYCAAYQSRRFSIAGGGLESERVIDAAVAILSRPEVIALDIECQLFLGMKAIVDSGGEKLLFSRMAFVIDDLSPANRNYRSIIYRNRNPESILLQQLKSQLGIPQKACGI